MTDHRSAPDPDSPPPEYTRTHGEAEADIEHTGQIYPAVVTAHFPDKASTDRVLDQLGAYEFQNDQAIQVFDKEPPEVPGDVQDPGLKEGEYAIIVQLDDPDEALGAELVRLCEEAGAIHARYFPEQRIGSV